MRTPEEQIAESIPEFFFIWDLKKNKIIYLTDSFDKVSTQPKQKESLEEIRGIIAEEETEKFNKAFSAIEQGEYFQDIEMRTANVFNGTKWINMKTYPVNIENGEILNVAGQFLDITDKKKRQEKIERQSEEIEDILHILAHDIRGPLGNILNIARAQKSTSDSDFDVIRNFAVLIEKIADNTLYMMENMIETVKVTSKGFRIEPTTVILQNFFDNILTSYRNSLHEKQINLKKHYPDQDVIVEIDEIKFRLVIQNLITNAIKFTPNGGTISLNLTTEDDQVVIEVQDTGIGISNKNLEQIFTKFSPVRKDGVRGEKSFGLGLSISKKIVELHKGTIEVESEVGNGTTFSLRLPGIRK